MVSELPNKRLVPRRRHKNVIEAPLPPQIVGGVLEQIDAKLRSIWRAIFVLEFLSGLYILNWYFTTHPLSVAVRLYGTALSAVYCVVILFNWLHDGNTSKLSSIFSLLWLGAAGTVVAYHSMPEVPIAIGGVLCIGYSLLGDKSLSRQACVGYATIGFVWLLANWGFPVRPVRDATTVKVSLVLAVSIGAVVLVSRKISEVQAARIFGDSIRGLEGMQQALAQLHNKQVARKLRESEPID